MTRDELIAQAIRITAAVAHGDGCAPAVVADAREVSYALIEQALAAGAATDPLERKRAGARDRSQRMRDRKRDEVARVTPDDTPSSRQLHTAKRDVSVTERDSGRDAPPSALPLSDLPLPLNAAESQEEERQKSDASANESASRSVTLRHAAAPSTEQLEPRVSRETIDPEPPDDDELYGDGSNPYERPEGKLASQLIRVWERVAGGGNPVGDTSTARRQLEALQPALLARCNGEPVEHFERVLAVYVQRKREKKATPKLRFFCADYAELADELALAQQAPTLTPGVPVAQKITALRRVWFEARVAQRAASEQGDHYAREHHGGEASRAWNALVTCGYDVEGLEAEFEAAVARKAS